MTAISKPKRFLVNTVLAAGLLFSQAGTLLVAALCPHLQSSTASCETQQETVAQTVAMSHEAMGHGDHMEMEAEPVAQPDPDAFALSQPVDPCSHCAVHSRTTLTIASLRATEATRRSVDLSLPLHSFRVAPVSMPPAANLSARAHGPPGESIPRHIVLNIFRI